MKNKNNTIGETYCPVNVVFSDSDKEELLRSLMTNEETVTISKEEYYALVADSLWLQDLENAGVDNWPGFEYALEERALRESGNTE